MDITYINQTNMSEFDAFEADLKPLLEKTLLLTKFPLSVNLSIVLVDDETIQGYNKDFRNIDRPTDVLSFIDGENIDGDISLGDIIVSTQTAHRQALEYQHSLKREFLFLVVHGYLHLLGYDHMNEKDETEMFSLQRKILDEYIPR